MLPFTCNDCPDSNPSLRFEAHNAVWIGSRFSLERLDVAAYTLGRIRAFIQRGYQR